MVLPQKPEEQEETPELITPTEEKVEVIKVCELVFLLLFVCIVVCGQPDPSCLSELCSSVLSNKPLSL